jgi:hypothetical protein
VNNSIELLKKHREDFRVRVRKLKDSIEEQRLEFECMCVKEARQATAIDLVHEILKLTYTGTHARERVLERWFELCVTPDEIIEFLVFSESYCYWLTQRVIAHKKLEAMTYTATVVASSKKDLEILSTRISFIVRQAKHIYASDNPDFASRAQHMWSMKFARHCDTSSELGKYKNSFTPELYQSRLNLLYKQERGYSEGSPRGRYRISYM